MDIVSNFKVQNSTLFPKASSPSFQTNAKAKTMNFSPSGNARVGSSSSIMRPQQLPSPSQVSTANGPQNLFFNASQDQRRSRSASLGNAPANSAVVATRDRSATEDFTDTRRVAGGNTNGPRGLSSSKVLAPSASSTISTQLPSLRNTFDHTQGNCQVVPSLYETVPKGSGSVLGNINNSSTSTGASLPLASSSLSSYSSSPTDCASMFVTPKFNNSKASSAASAVKNTFNSSLFLSVDHHEVKQTNPAATNGGSRSKTPSPLTAPFIDSAAASSSSSSSTSDKKKVRFAEPIFHVEPRVKVNAESAVSVPGKVAVMTATGDIREVRPILKGTAPPFGSTKAFHPGIATGLLSDPHSFTGSKRGTQTGARGDSPSCTAMSMNSAITSTMNAISSMNNTLSNKNMVALSLSSNTAHNHTNNGHSSHPQLVNGNRGVSPASLTRISGAGALPRPSIANGAISSSVSSSPNSLVTIASGYSTSSRDSVIREMMLLDSPTNASTLAFNARDSLTAQSAHLMRRAMEKLHLSEQQSPQQHLQQDAGKTVDESPRVDEASFSYIDPAAPLVLDLQQHHQLSESPFETSHQHLQNGTTHNNRSSGSSGTAVAFAPNELRNHHFQSVQTRQQSAAVPTAAKTAQTQQFEPLFSDRRRPRTAGPGTMSSQPLGEFGSQGLLSSSSSKVCKEMQEPLLGTIGLLSATLGPSKNSNESVPLQSALNSGAHANLANNNGTLSISSDESLLSFSSLFSLPAKSITLANVSCSAVAPVQFFPITWCCISNPRSSRRAR